MSFKTSNAGLVERDEQSSELTVERPGSFIDLLTVEIRSANFELK